MDKKYIAAIITVGLVAIFAIGWQIWQTASSYLMVRFVYDLPSGQATLNDAELNEIKINHNQPIRLKKGSYRVAKSGDGVKNDYQYIEVKDGAVEFAVNFDLEDAKLQTLLAEESSAINQAIIEKFPSLNQLYEIKNQTLFHHGEYFGASLVFKDQSHQMRDTLKILLKKEDGTWQVLSNPPRQILSAPDFPDVPSDILKAINQAE